MPHPAKRIAAYAAELAFALRSGATWAAGLSLAARTLAFHLHNASNRSPRLTATRPLPLRLAGSRLDLALRPYSGDLFVFYEVFLHHAYALPSDWRPDQVRTIIDCGANIGLASLYFAAVCPNARILAIEPHPGNFQLLLANTAQQPRITCLQCCVGPADGQSVFIGLDRPAWGNSLSTAGHPIVARSLESLIAEHSFESVDLLKVDIEGAERELFAAPAFLEAVRLVLIELHGDYSLRRFRADLAPFHFDLYPAGTLPGTRVVAALARAASPLPGRPFPPPVPVAGLP